MGCCDNTTKKSPAASVDSEQVRLTVRQGYAAIAQSHEENSVGLTVLGKGGCCGSAGGPTYTADQLAQQIGYGAQEIAQLPDGANMGLSCGNPTAIANLKPGQVVLDLGSGGGFDVFLAGPKVGPTGRVIGVDMTPEMLIKARKNIATYQQRTGLSNVEFRLGEIEHLPIADASVDVVISNCVINLSPDKQQVWREIARVLKPGGTVAASDMALLKPLPQKVAHLVEAMVGCVAGAVLLETYRDMIASAGLTNITLRPKPEYVDALVEAQDPLYQIIMAALPAGTRAGEFITSVDVTACKSATGQTIATSKPGSCCQSGSGTSPAPRKNKVLIYACSGAANVAEIADHVARQLTAEGLGQMYCLAGLGADLPNMVQTAREADLNLVIDGCPTDCAKTIFQRLGLTNVVIVRVTDHGIAKAKGEKITDQQVQTILEQARAALARA